jgi:glycerol-3-phosphate dehydrogenase
MTWDRASHLDRLQTTERFDAVVVGGGIVGAGTTLDLATRGLSVALLERTDFASETSSRSSKLLHGGIRYLPQFRFGLVREGLLEQKVLERNADYLFQPLEFILPYYRDRGFGDVPRWIRHPLLIPYAFHLGLALYDRLGRRSKRRHRKLTREQVLAKAPLLDPAGLTGGFSYYDALTDDARLTLAVAKTAVRHFGATAVNWAHVETVHPEPGGFVVELFDRLGNQTHYIHSRAVVSATGPFPPAGQAKREGVMLAKGVHLAIDPGVLGIDRATLVLPETEDGRVLFLIPWLGSTWVGTTDTPFHGDPDHPVADQEDIDYLLNQLRRYLTVTDIPYVTAVAGIRALAAGGGNTAKASRSPKVRQVTPGHVAVVGGKLTGYRPLAKKVADKVADHLGVKRRSRTRDTPLVGSGAKTVKLPAGTTPTRYLDDVYQRYGSEAAQILEAPNFELLSGDRLADAEVRYLVANEAAATIADVLLRRTHLAWILQDHGRALARQVAEVMAAELGWTDQERDQQLDGYDEVLKLEGL